MSLLFATHPLIVNPELAALVGLNEAIVLQQVHYWLKDTSAGINIDGVRWIYNSAEDWLKQFPFWSESTVKRAITNLKRKGLLKVEQMGKKNRDMTNYFSINYASPLLTSEISEVPVNKVKKSGESSNLPSGQNDKIDQVILNSSMKSKCTDAVSQNDVMDKVKMTRSIGSKRHDDLTETTTKTTTEIIKPSCPVSAKPDREVMITDQAIEVLNHLNRVKGSRFQKSKSSLENIRARIRDGYSVGELKLVIDLKHEHWRDNFEMYLHLCPETLFGPKKFEKYLQSAIGWERNGRPPREAWDTKRERDVNAIGPCDNRIPEGFRG